MEPIQSTEVIESLDTSAPGAEEMITLISRQDDGDESTWPRVECPKKATKMANLFKTTLEMDETAKEIIVAVGYDTLKCIVEYMVYHYGKEEPKAPLKPLRYTNIKKCLAETPYAGWEWDIDFIRRCKTWKELENIINATHYIDLPALFSLSAAYWASFIKKPDEAVDDMRPEEEIRALFAIETLPVVPE